MTRSLRRISTDIQRVKHDQRIAHEMGLRGPFQHLLDKAAKKHGWTLVPELSTYSGGKRVVPDGTVRDEFRLARGWWEAKDTSDKLASEIQKKLKAGYPTRNTIFEDTQTAVLYQDRSEAGEFSPRRAGQDRRSPQPFFSHDETDEREFHRAMEEFKSRIPDLAQSLREHIDGRAQDQQEVQGGVCRVCDSLPRFPESGALRRARRRDADPASADRAADAEPVSEPRVH